MPPTTQSNLELTTREREFLRLYKKHQDAYGAPPGMILMARYLGVALSAAQYLRDKIIAKGYATRIAPPARGRPNTIVRIKFTAKGKKALP